MICIKRPMVAGRSSKPQDQGAQGEGDGSVQYVRDLSLSPMRNAGVVLPFCELSFSVPKPPDSRIPREIVTLGDHLRKRRIELGLTLKQVGEKFEVGPKRVLCWEQGHHQPHPKHHRGIIEFLGYDPFPGLIV